MYNASGWSTNIDKLWVCNENTKIKYVEERGICFGVFSTTAVVETTQLVSFQPPRNETFEKIAENNQWINQVLYYMVVGHRLQTLHLWKTRGLEALRQMYFLQSLQWVSLVSVRRVGSVNEIKWNGEWFFLKKGVMTVFRLDWVESWIVKMKNFIMDIALKTEQHISKSPTKICLFWQFPFPCYDDIYSTLLRHLARAQKRKKNFLKCQGKKQVITRVKGNSHI